LGARTTRELLDIAMSHSLGEEAVRAIFDRNKGKAKREEHTKEDAPDRFSKKKNKKGPGAHLSLLLNKKEGELPTQTIPTFLRRSLRGHAQTMPTPSSTRTRTAPARSGSCRAAPRGGAAAAAAEEET